MGGIMRVYYQKEHQRITNNTDSGQRLIVTDATGDRWGIILYRYLGRFWEYDGLHSVL